MFKGFYKVNKTNRLLALTMCLFVTFLFVLDLPEFIDLEEVPTESSELIIVEEALHMEPKHIEIAPYEPDTATLYREAKELTLPTKPGLKKANTQPDEQVEKHARISYTESELDLFERLLQCEAGSTGESQELRIAVASAIVNRVTMDYYPDNLDEMINQVIDGVYQFEPVYTGKINRVTASDDVKIAAQEGLIEDHIYGCWAFYNPSVYGRVEWFHTLEFVVEIDGVHFFR